MSVEVKNTIIYLLGLPGTGKYTVAKEICRRSQARLIDNHLINNPVFSVVGADGKTKLPKEIWDYTTRIGDIVREAVVKLTPPEGSFVFTNALRQEDPRDHALYSKIFEVAEQRQSLFVPVRLLCDLPTLQQRITERDRHERMKMTDPAGIERQYNNSTILIPDHPHRMDLDITHLLPHEAANAILSHIEGLHKTKE